MSSELVNYIAEKPVVQQLNNYLHNKYNTTKNSVPLVGYVVSKSYNCASYMVEKLTPVAVRSLVVSTKIIKPVVGEVDDPIKSLDHYACEKLKGAEQTLDTVVECSQQKIHNARLKAEDFFIGKCVHTAYTTTNSAVGGIEKTLENMSLIRKRTTTTTTGNNSGNNSPSKDTLASPLSQRDFDRTEFEFLKTKQFEARQNLLNIFANPELWNDRMTEYRMLSGRINDLHKRFINDGFLSNVHCNMAHLVSFYVTAMESIFITIVSSVSLCASKVYNFNKQLLMTIKNAIKLMAVDPQIKTTELAQMFSKSMNDTYNNSTNKVVSTYEQLDLLTRLYFRFYMARLSYLITNNVLPKTHAYIRHCIPFVFNIYFTNITQYTSSLCWMYANLIEVHNSSSVTIKHSSEYKVDDVATAAPADNDASYNDDFLETASIESMEESPLSGSNVSFYEAHSEL